MPNARIRVEYPRFGMPPSADELHDTPVSEWMALIVDGPGKQVEVSRSYVGLLSIVGVALRFTGHLVHGL